MQICIISEPAGPRLQRISHLKVSKFAPLDPVMRESESGRGPAFRPPQLLPGSRVSCASFRDGRPGLGSEVAAMIDGMTHEELQARVEKLHEQLEAVLLDFEVETHEKVSVILLRRFGDVAKVHVQLAPAPPH
jgi:hypothetical protein